MHTVKSKICGPHFEAAAAERAARYAAARKDPAVSPAGQAVIACRERKAGYETASRHSRRLYITCHPTSCVRWN